MSFSVPSKMSRKEITSFESFSSWQSGYAHDSCSQGCGFETGPWQLVHKCISSEISVDDCMNSGVCAV